MTHATTIHALDTDEHAREWANHKNPLGYGYDLLEDAGVTDYDELKTVYDDLAARWNARNNGRSFDAVSDADKAAGVEFYFIVEIAAGTITNTIDVTVVDGDVVKSNTIRNTPPSWVSIHTADLLPKSKVFVRTTTLDKVETVVPWLESEPYKFRSKELAGV